MVVGGGGPPPTALPALETAPAAVDVVFVIVPPAVLPMFWTVLDADWLVPLSCPATVLATPFAVEPTLEPVFATTCAAVVKTLAGGWGPHEPEHPPGELTVARSAEAVVDEVCE